MAAVGQNNSNGADLSDVVEQVVKAYNTKNFGRYAMFLAEELTYRHHTRGIEFGDRATFLALQRVYASDLVPGRTYGAAKRLTLAGNTVVREHTWSGTPLADFPGVAKADEPFALELCSVFVFEGDTVTELHEYG